MTFAHTFDPTALREYDIRGVVGRSLHPDDAFAIGRVFGTIVARGGARWRSATTAGCPRRTGGVADARDPRLQGEAIRIGRGPTPMLYLAATMLATDGAVMVTGGHNPPDYNGFKMMIARKPFYGEEIRQLGRMARDGDVVEENKGAEVQGERLRRLPGAAARGL